MSASRRVEVLLFAGLRQLAGRSAIEVEFAEGGTVADLRRALVEQFPALGPLGHCRMAVDQAFVDDRALVPAGAELALIPPVSGGHDGPRAVQLLDTPLELGAVVDCVSHARAGGLCTFTGQVREQSRGKQVVRLEYEAYPAMAVSAMQGIVDAIESSVEGSRVAIHHRVGRLGIGDVAVVIAASAPHRAEAFEACRAAIEALKRDVPIWKKEFDAQGGEWIGQGP